MQTIPASDPLSSLPDAALVRCFAVEASAEAFAALVGRYHGLVHGTARRILHDGDGESKALPISLQDTGRTAIARGWGRRDPKGALAAAEKLNANNEGARLSFLQEVFTGWLHVDAAAAVRALPALPVDDQRRVASAFDELAKAPTQRASATVEIAKLTDDTVRGEVAHYVTEDWAKFDGSAAAAWLDALPWENSRASLEAAGELMKEWGKGRDQMAPALDWFWPKVPEELRPDILEEFVAGKWAKVDRAGAEAWLAKHGIATSDVPDWDRLTR